MKGEQLKKLRKNLGLKQYELAETIGISKEWIGKLERGLGVIQKSTELAVWCLLYESGIKKPNDRLKAKKSKGSP